MKQYVSNLYHQDESRQIFQKRMLSVVLSVIAVLMALINFLSGDALYGGVMVFYFGFVLTSMTLFGKKSLETVATGLMGISSVLVLLYALFFGSDNLTTLLWLAVIPSLSMMFLRLRWAVTFLSGTFTFLAVLYLSPLADWLHLPENPAFPRWFFVAAHGIFAVVCGTLEFLRHLTDLRLEESRKEILRLSFFDDLTQIFNRRSFDASLLKLWNNPAQTRKMTSLLMIDIDNFKMYNDNYGHLQGDKILTKIALAIRSAIPSDRFTIARYGGEEFVVLMPETDEREAIEIAELIKETVGRLELIYFDSNESVSKNLSVSIGVATQQMAELDSPETLIRIADENLYRAKRSGKNSVWSATDNLPHS